MTVKEAIEVLAQHAAETRNPSILAALKHVEAGLDGQHEQRPMDRHDSPGMRSARQHTRPEYHKGGPRDREPRSESDRSGDSPGAQAAARGSRSESPAPS